MALLAGAWAPRQRPEPEGEGDRRGLDWQEAGARLEADGPNELPPAPRERLLSRTVRHLREPMSLLLIVAAAVDGVGLGEWIDAAAILAIVVVNTVIALAQEGRASQALESLREFETPTARVRREGTIHELPARDLVVGDVVVLEGGDRVPADARLLHSSNVEVDESILTGESEPATKDAAAHEDESAGLGDQQWMAFSGTLVTRGTAEGRVAATGTGTVIGKLAGSLADPRPVTPLQAELRHLTIVLGGAAVVIAAGVSGLVVARQGFNAEAAQDAFLAGVALAVAAVPEGLATVAVVGLALGVRRMARQGAIIRRLVAVETLGSATTLALDKTGTLTQNRMHLDSVVTADGETWSAGSLPPATSAAFARVAVLCSEASLEPPSGDPLEQALLDAVGQATVDRLRGNHPRTAGAPFDSDRRRMTVVHEIDGERCVLVKGAPEVVIERCARALVPGGDQELDDDTRAALLGRVDDLASQGFRMLVLAERVVSGDAPLDTEDALDAHEQGLTLVALAVLRDPVRAEAAGAVREATRAGIRLMMVTGDHPRTALAIATEVGLAEPGTDPVTGAEMRAHGIPATPLDHPVYARVDPEQKLALVNRLREQGEIVGMTGDGVNDAPSLRAADIGVALGERGSEVAKEAADMVLTDDNLATIVGAVRGGRGIYDNIRKVVEYLVAGNLSEVAVVVVALLAFPALGVPLFPLQLLWINLLTDGLPALALGVDPVDPAVMHAPPRAAGSRILEVDRVIELARRATVITAAALTGLVVSHYPWDASWEKARVVMFTTLVATHLLYAFSLRWSGRAAGARLLDNRWLLGAVAGGLALQAVVVTWSPLHEVFETQALGLREWSLVAGLATAAAVVVGATSRRE